MVQRRPLSLPREGRWIGGVCKAFSLTYGWDVSLVRILTVLLTILCLPIMGQLIYIVAWIVIPEEPLESVLRSAGNTTLLHSPWQR
jgi:phage shock protein C